MAVEMRPTLFPSLFYTTHEGYEETAFADDSTVGQKASASISLQSQLKENIVILAWASLLAKYTGHESVCFFVNTLSDESELDSETNAVAVDIAERKIQHVRASSLLQNSTRLFFNSIQRRHHQDGNLTTSQDRQRTRTTSHVDLPEDSNAEFRISSHAATPTDSDVDRQSLASTSSESACTGHTSPSKSSNVFLDDPRFALNLSYTPESGKVEVSTFFAVPKCHLANLARQLANEVHFASSALKLHREDLLHDELALSLSNVNPRSLAGPRLLHELASPFGIDDQTSIEHLYQDGSKQQLSYHLLAQQSHLLAQKIQDTLPSTKRLDSLNIPILLPQSPELYIGMLAILRFGSAFCPINLDTPQERIKFIFQDVGAQVFITTAEHAKDLGLLTGVPCCIVDLETPESQHDLSRIFRPCTPTDPAYIMYSTPKGVVLSHTAVTQSLLAHNPKIPQFSRFLQFAAPTFDVSMYEIFFTFYRGATLVSCDRTTLLSDLPGVINDLNVDGAELTPTVAGTLLKSRDYVPNLKVLLTIGEMLNRHVIAEFGDSRKASPILYAMYGPTEAAIHCTMEAALDADARTGIIGRPFDTVSALVIAPATDTTKTIEVLPLGYIGELALGGHQLATCYLNRKEQTDAAFLQHADYGRIYRTGDKARMLPNGMFECLGRISTGQVKLRGQRIELGEIEHAAMQCESCVTAVALVVSSTLILFCHAAENDSAKPSLSEQAVSDSCKQWLPPHMLPNEIFLWNEFPRLPSGKIDRKKLQTLYEQMQTEAPNSRKDNVDDALVSDIATIVHDIVGHLPSPDLRLSRVGVNSLTAIKIASQVRHKFQLSVAAYEILRTGTVRSLSQLLEARRNSRHHSQSQPAAVEIDVGCLREIDASIDLAKVQKVTLCTPLQSIMLAETMSNDDMYWNWVELRSNRTYRPNILASSLKEILQRNEILRTGFLTPSHSQPRFLSVIAQQVHDSVIKVVSPQKLDAAKFERLQISHPLRVNIEDSGNRILIRLHHALYDGWTIDLLVSDLSMHLSEGRLPDRPQFDSVVAYSAAIDDSSSLDRAKDYWESTLKGVNPIPLPLMPVIAGPIKKPQRQRQEIVSCLSTDAFSKLGEYHPQIFFQLALAYVLGGITGNEDVVLGSVTSGRSILIEDIENVYGPCIATLPLRIKLHSHSTIFEALTQIRDDTLLSQEHSMISPTTIRQLSQVDSRQRLFDTLFIWQESLVRVGSTEASFQVSNSADDLEFALVLEVEPREKTLLIRLTSDERYIDEEYGIILLQHIDRFAQSFSNALQVSQDQDFCDIAAADSSRPSLILASPVIKTKQLELEKNLRRESTLANSKALISDVAPIPMSILCFDTANQVPIGFIGELAIHSGSEPPSRTGQIARLLSHNQLEILGEKRKFKRLGSALINVEIVARELSKALAVDEVAVVIKADSVVSFWVPGTLDAVDSNDVHLADIKDIQPEKDAVSAQFTAASLLHLLPHYLVPVSRIPRDLRGSVNEVVLLDYLTEHPYTQSARFSTKTIVDNEQEQSENSLERRINAVVSNVLQVESSSITRSLSLFRIGLDSISAIAIARNLEKKFQTQMSVSALLQHSTIGRLASFIAHSMSRQRPKITAGVSRPSETVKQQVEQQLSERQLHVERVRSCTPLQTAMTAATGENYVNHTSFNVLGNVVRLKNAFEQAQKKHDILRTIFLSSDDAIDPVIQVVIENIGLPWYEENTDPVRQTSGALSLAIDTCVLPWSLTQVQGSEPTKLIFSMHHALYDAAAFSQLLSDVENFYYGEAVQAKASFDHFLENSLHAMSPEADDFWMSMFRDFQPSKVFPERQPQRVTKFATHGISTSVSLSTFQEQAKLHAVTLQTLVQAVWAIVLCRISNSQDVCFGTVFSGRTTDLPHIDRLVAPCFNTLPLRLRISKRLSIEDLFSSVSFYNGQMLEHQFTPLRHIHSVCHVDGESLFETLVILQHTSAALDSNIWKLTSDEGDMGVPLVCEFIPDHDVDKLRIRLQAQTGVASLRALEQIATAIDHVLEGCVMDDYVDLEAAIQSIPSLDGLALMDHQPSHSSNDNSETTADSRVEALLQKAIGLQTGSHVQEVRVDKSIFQLGIDSISALQLARKLRSEGLDISSNQILKGRTVRGIASLLTRGHAAPSTPNIDLEDLNAQMKRSICDQLHIPNDHMRRVLPCTHLQTGTLASFVHTNGATYFNRMQFKLKSSISIDKLQAAWNKVFRYHDILHTGFVSTEDPKHPFIMLQYESDTYSLPWKFLNTESEQTQDQLAEAHYEAIQNYLNNLHRLPWQVTILAPSSGQAVMQLSMHHALYDAYSLHVLIVDIQKAYSAEPLSSVPIDQALMTVLSSESDPDGRHEAFWKSRITASGIVRFPNLTPLRVENRQIRRRKMQCSFRKPLLAAKCRQKDATLQAVFQTAWAKLLIAYTGENVVTFGIVLSGRDQPVTENVMLPVATTVPCQLIHGSTADMLKSALDFNVSIQDHQHSPLPDIQRWIRAHGEAIFDTLLVYQSSIDSDDDEMFWNVDRDEATVEYPVSIDISVHEGEMTFEVVFWNDVLPTKQAEILLQQFDSLVLHVLDDSEKALELPKGLLSILPPKTPRIPSDANTLHGLVELAAATFPNRNALEFYPSLDEPPLSWTYRELNIEADHYAAQILSKGARAGDIIAVCFDKCPEASIALLGILKAGCLFVALDVAAPSSRKLLIVEDSGASMVITNRTSSKAFLDESCQTPLLLVEEIEQQQRTPNDFASVSPQHGAYCLYTSGSTGKPKGCIISHDNVVQFIMFFQRMFHGRHDHDSRFLQFASFHFDVSVMEHFFSWSVGICLVSTPRDILFADLPASLNKLKITHIDLTPSLARLITPEQVPSLCKGIFITGGEPLKQEVLDAWASEDVIYNGYGPTEVTIGCTMFPRVPKNGKPSNIGPQYDNAGTFVFTPNTTKLVPRGAVGELCVSGVLVGQGYLKRPDLTRECFPFLEEYGEKVYRTRDLVRLLHDGTFDFVGRCDDQVKLRGQRLELGEVDAAILDAGIRLNNVVSLVVKFAKGSSEQLVSFIVVNPRDGDMMVGEQDSTVIQKIKSSCSERLPQYMVPSHIIILNRIPLSANNKSDANELRRIFQDFRAESRAEKTQWMLSRQEAIIADTFADHFGISRDLIKPTSNLFEMGLDSIAVFGVSHRLIAAGLIAAQPRIIMKSHTVQSLARLIKDSGQNSRDPSRAVKQDLIAFGRRYRLRVSKSLGCAANDLETVLPCTPLQEGMIARSSRSDKGLYFNQILLQLDSDLMASTIHSAWQRLTEVTPILRTRFVGLPSGCAQAVLKNAKVSLYERLCSLDLGEEVDQIRKAWITKNQENVTVPIELHSLRSENQQYLLINIFHGLYDAISLDIMLQDVAKVCSGQELRQKEPTFQEILPSGPLARLPGADSFWTNHLSSARITPIRKENNTTNVVVARRVISLDDNDEKARRGLNVTHQAIVQTAWVSVLQAKVGSQTTIGIVVSGRSLDVAGAENVVGPMFNTIPCFPNISHNSNWASAVRTSHCFNVEALPYQSTPLRSIEKALRKHGQHIGFDSLFTFQKPDTTRGAVSYPWQVLDDSANADYPLAFEAVHENERLALQLVAQAGFLTQTSADALLEQVEAALYAITNNRDSSIASVVGMIEESPAHSTARETGREGDQRNIAFEWTSTARIVQSEVARLSSIDLEQILPQTSIFELGLDSVDAIKLAATLKRHDLLIRVSDIVRHGTIEAIARATSASAKQEAKSSVQYAHAKQLFEHIRSNHPIPDMIEEVRPATPLQEAIVVDMLRSSYGNYFNHDILELANHVDIDHLKSAWSNIIERTPVLRTQFEEIRNISIKYAFAQVILRRHESFWNTVAGETPDIHDVMNRVRDEVAKDTRSVPFRLTLLPGTKPRKLIVSISHALYDGWSLQLLHHDVLTAYGGYFYDRPGPEILMDRIMNANTPDAIDFWKESLSNASSCLLNEANETSDSSWRCERQSSASLHDLQNFCKQQGVGLQALGQLCWSLILAQYTKTLDVLFGVVLSGRDDEESQSVLFPTMNTVVARTIIHGSCDELLHDIHNNIADLLQYQHFPLREIQKVMGRRNEDMFNSLFIYQQRPDSDEKHAPLWTSVDDASAITYPVCIEMEVVETALVWRTACNASIFTNHDAEQILKLVDVILERISQNPARATLEFTDQGVSILGMDSFQLFENKHGDAQADTSISFESNSWSTSEEAARGVLAKISGSDVQTIAKQDTIYNLGLDSISAIKMVSLLRSQGYQTTVSRILRAGTVARIAQDLETKPSPKVHKSFLKIEESFKDVDSIALARSAGIDPDTLEATLPATPAQVYFIMQWLQSRGSLFYSTFHYDLSGIKDSETIRRAWRILVEQTPMLRAIFISTGRTDLPFLQVFRRKTEAKFQLLANGQDYANQSNTLLDPPVVLLAKQIGRGFELQLQLHHALYDAVSLPLIISKLESILKKDDRASNFTWEAYNEFLQPILAESIKTSRKIFWKSYLEGVPSEQVAPLAASASRISTYQPRILATAALSNQLRKTNASFHALFLAAFGKARAKRLDNIKLDLVIGLYLANRAEMTKLEAPTVNILPLRIRLHKSVLDSAEAIQRDLQRTGNNGNESVGLWEIEEWTGVQIDCIVNFIKLPNEEDVVNETPTANSNVRITPASRPQPSINAQAPLVEPLSSSFEHAFTPSLDVEAAVRNGKLDIGVFGWSDRLSESEAKQLAKDIVSILEEFANSV